MNIEKIYELYKASKGVNTDTRSIQAGQIFFALQGPNFDANAFAEKALQAGAAYAVINDAAYAKDERYIVVKDSLETLQALAKYHRQQFKIPFIAITGSNGKTTTKELLFAVLSKKYRTYCTQGNFNNHIGIPLTLLQIQPGTEMAIIEMGANHRFEIEQLCAIAQPDYGFITNIGKAHLEGFGGEIGVARGKTELYYYLYKNNGKAFINMNEEKTMYYSRHLECIYFSSAENEYRIASPISFSPKTEFELSGIKHISVLSGEYNFNNILAAIAMGNYFGIDAEKTGEAIASYIPGNMRHQWVDWNSNKVLLDAYNANPDSMYHALKNFDELESKHTIVVLGDMFELGNDAKDEHQVIINAIGDYDFEQALVCGEFFSAATALNSVKVFKTFDELKDYFDKQNFKEKTILIKGSRGMKMERLIDN